MMHPEGGHCRVPLHPSDHAFAGVCPFHGTCVEGLVSNVSIKERLGLSSVDQVKDIPDIAEVWDVVAHYLGTFCANLYLTLSVERIILGGGVMNRAILLDKIRKVFSE